MKSERKKAGPSRTELFLSLPGLLKNPLDQFLAWNRRYGDVIVVPIRRPPTLHLSNPEDIRHILTVNPSGYRKTGALTIGKRLIGQGLLASREPLHSQQRRIAQPHFVRHSVQAFAPLIRETTLQHLAHWSPGEVIDVFPEMAHLTIAIIGKAYFSTDLSREAATLFHDFGICQQFMQKLVNLPEGTPIPLYRRYREAVRRIDKLVRGLIQQRLASRDRPADLLTTLLEAKDTSGNPLSENQVRDEMVNILLAGHETTAIALAWTWYFLSLHPDVDEAFHAELRTIHDEGILADSIWSRMTYAEMVLNESMRLRPPVWILGRIAIRDDLLPSGTCMPEGTEVLMLPYIAHRNPAFFPDPEAFSPDRFGQEQQNQRRPFVFFPFGGGPRGCIGEAFARMEALIILSIVGSRFSFRLVEGHPVVPEPLVTLRPKHGIRMQIHGRTKHAPSAADRVYLQGARTTAISPE